MTDHAKRIEIARQLFAGWSSGDPDAPEPFMTPDAVLNDVASGRFEGWPAIRAFFAKGLAKWDDLVLAPDEFWVNDDGLALHYLMSATVKDAAMFGEEHVGKKWEVEVMSFLRFDGDRICYEPAAGPLPRDHVARRAEPERTDRPSRVRRGARPGHRCPPCHVRRTQLRNPQRISARRLVVGSGVCGIAHTSRTSPLVRPVLAERFAI